MALKVASEDPADNLRLLRHDHQLPLLHPIAKGNASAHPDAPALGGDKLVPYAFADDFALVFGEGHQHVEHHLPRRGRCVNLLCHADERDIPLGEVLGEVGEVAEGAAQPVHLIDDHRVYQPRLAVLEELLQRGTAGVAAREATVVIVGRDAYPAVGFL